MRGDGLEEIYLRFSGEVYLYALALCKNTAAAEDLTSETFYKALLSLDAGHTGIKYWLFHVCKNLFIDGCRKNRLLETGFEQTARTGENHPLDTVLKDESRKELYRALLMLSETDRELLTLYYFLDCSIRQIASQLSRTPGAVKTGMSRARVRLKKHLEEIP